MKFSWSTLRVQNMEESVKFYTEVVGLEVVDKFPAGPGSEITFLGNQETKIELISDNNTRETSVGSDISWGFEVESLDKMLDHVKEKGIAIESGPIQPNPHIKMFFVKDPNGMRIQFVEHIG